MSYIHLLISILKTRISYRKNGPFKLLLILTNKCNSRCKNCDIWKIYKKNPSLSSTELTKQQIKSIFEQFDNLSIVEISGGEPFMRGDILEVLRIVSDSLHPASFIGITTNGFLGPKIIRDMKKALPTIKQKVVMAVSIDGLEKEHSATRGIKNAFEIALKTYLGLKEIAPTYRNFLPHISYTIFPENAGKLKTFLAEIKEKYNICADEVSITLGQQGDLYKNNKLDWTKNKIDKAKDDINYLMGLSAQSKSNIFLKLKTRFKRFYLKGCIKFIDKPKKMVIPCKAMVGSVYIEQDGNVKPCITWNKSLGNLKVDKFKDIWLSGQAFQLRAKIKQEKCPNCWAVCEAQPAYLLNWKYFFK